MTIWTPEAEVTLRAHLESIRHRLAQDGADAQEVAENLRSHIEEELKLQGVKTATAEQVSNLLAQIGDPELDFEIPAEQPPVSPTASHQLPHGLKAAWNDTPKAPFGLWFILFGVIYPLVVTLAELFTRMCTDTFFDPMPTWGHTLLILMLPLTNLLIRRHVRGQSAPPFTWLSFMLGINLAVSAVYCLVMLPLVPFSLIAIMFMGMGLLTFAPYVGLFASMHAFFKLRDAGGSWVGWGAVTGFVLLCAISFQGLGTKMNLAKANSEDPERSHKAIAWLRTFGDRDLMHRACFGALDRAGEFAWFGQSNRGAERLTLESARETYYRVTGESFNSKPFEPRLFAAQGEFSPLGGARRDRDRGGEDIGGRQTTLNLIDSRIDGVLDAQAGFVYYEWTQIFKNTDNDQAEARLQVELPHGGAVSRLTLWVNGEEREAVFAGRNQTRQAYENVVRQRLDPVLVTASGPDQVLVQCFPVPPNGGVMKIRFGITAPLQGTSATAGRVHPPRIIDRNFTIAETVKHQLWVESHAALASSFTALKAEQPDAKTYALRGELSDDTMLQQWPRIDTQRPFQTTARAVDAQTSGQSILVSLVSKPAPVVPSVVLAIDGSAGVQAFLPEIAAALREMTPGVRINLVVARDEPETIKPGSPGTRQGNDELADAVERLDLIGGCDNLPGLMAAWNLAAETPGTRVLWLHGPQPFTSAAEALIQHHQRRPNGPSLETFALIEGENKVFKELTGQIPLTRHERWGGLKDDLAALFKLWGGGVPVWQFERQLLPAGNPSMPDLPTLDQNASGHIARLWALDEIGRVSNFPSQNGHKNHALELAVRYRLVTSLSGAVVLENDEQYRQAGLKPPDVDQADIPTIPEPEVWALMLVVIIVLTATARARRRGLPWRLA